MKGQVKKIDPEFVIILRDSMRCLLRLFVKCNDRSHSVIGVLSPFDGVALLAVLDPRAVSIRGNGGRHATRAKSNQGGGVEPKR